MMASVTDPSKKTENPPNSTVKFAGPPLIQSVINLSDFRFLTLIGLSLRCLEPSRWRCPA